MFLRLTNIPESPYGLISVDSNTFNVGDIEVVPIRLYHHKLPVYGFRFGNFAYLTDFNTIEDAEFKKLTGVDFLVICALRKESHISHLNLKSALDIIEKLSPKRLILHI